MFTIDTKTSDTHYIILQDGVEFCKINKINSLEDVKKHFNINDVEEEKKTLEKEILQELEALGWVYSEDNGARIFTDKRRANSKIIISPALKWYATEGKAVIRIQEHKLLNRLFKVWRWFKNDR